MKKTRLLLSISMILFTAATVLAQRPSASFTTPTLLCSNQEVALTSTSSSPLGTVTREKWIFLTGNPEDTVSLVGQGNTVRFPLEAGSYIVNLIAFSADGQSDTADGIVRVDVAPEAGYSSNIRCFPERITLTDTSTTQDGTITGRRWQIAGLTSINRILDYNGAVGRLPLQLSVSGSNGCTDTINTTINYTDTPTLAFSRQGPITLCQGDSITLSVTGAENYSWNNGNLGSDNTVRTAGMKTVRGFNSAQCFATDSIRIDIVPRPVADAGSDITINEGESTTLLGSGGISYSWTPAADLSDARSANPIATPLQTTDYILSVSDANDCTDTDTVTVSVEEISSIPVHNLLTPNGDGLNDTWDLSTIPAIENANIYVINRWGWEVFKAEDGYNNDWDGSIAGEPLPDGSYLYIIEFDDDSRDPLRGALQIIRNLQK